MKPLKLSITIVVLSVASLVNAQKGLEIGPMFQYQSNWLTNSTDYDAGPELDVSRTFGMGYGLNLGYGFNERHGIRVGAFKSTQGQKYITSEEFTLLPAARSEILSEYLQVPVLYRYNGNLNISNTAFLLTVGPQFGMLQKVSGNMYAGSGLIADSSTIPTSILLKPSQDLKSFYNSLDISGQLGIGMIARFSKKFHMNAMLNFSYSLQDIESVNLKIPNRAATRNGIVALSVSFYYLMWGPEMSGPPKMK